MSNTKNKCLLMSMWVPTGSTEMGDYYVDIILKYFHPNDVYIGINCGTDHGFVEKLKRIFPNIKEVTTYMCINSDASGYQAALSILPTGSYENVVFGHTKGISYKSSETSKGYREYNEINFWSCLDGLIQLTVNNNIGIIGNNFMYDGNGPHLNEYHPKLNTICNLPNQPIMGFYANTFYIIKGCIIDYFIINNKNFFNTNLQNNGFDRYFFESSFPKIPSMLGYDTSTIIDNKLIVL